jgi:glycosyltransferase involved in cell wall biosynthesis
MLARRMRLLGLTNAYPPGSPGGYAEITADVMEGLAARGHDATMLVARMPAYAELARDAGTTPRVRVRRDLEYALAAWRRPLPGLRALRDDRGTMRELLSAERPDAAVVWHMRGVVKTPLNLLHDACVPVFYMLHDMWALYERPGSTLVPWARLDRLGVAAARRAARLGTPPIEEQGHVCFVSDWLRDEYARRGFRPRRSHVVRAGVDYDTLAAARRAPAAAPPVRILFAGRLHPDKGLHVVLDAMRRVDHAYELTVAGLPDDARYEARLREMARGLPVTWLGGVPRAQVVGLLGDHDVLVYPSTGPETYGLGILEAFAAGAVAVSSAVGGPAEYVVPGQNALTFEPGDVAGLAEQLRLLAEDPHLAPRLIAEGQATARSLSVDTIVGELERLLLDAAP